MIGHYQQKKPKQVIGMMNYEFGGKVTTEFVALKSKISLCKKIRQKVGR